MGACCSADARPDVPDKIQKDPTETEGVVVAVQGLKAGWFGGPPNDFGIWKGDKVPKDKEEFTQKMWMWMNKDTIDKKGKRIVIDVETFRRPDGDQKRGKGEVLWSAEMDEKPYFHQKHRYYNSNRSQRTNKHMRYNSRRSKYDSDDDDYYVNHKRHGRRNGTPYGPKVITKWCCDTNAEIMPGNTGRGEEYFGKDPLQLEVFAKGTGVTTWTKEIIHYEDNEGKKKTRTEIKKHTEEYVDVIEYTVVHRNKLMAQWEMEGDKSKYGAEEISCNNRFFKSELTAGWSSMFSTNAYTKITTKAPGDPALAMLLAHICSSEYSVNALKRDLVLSTPSKPPSIGGAVMEMGMNMLGFGKGKSDFDEDEDEAVTTTGKVTYDGDYDGTYFDGGSDRGI